MRKKISINLFTVGCRLNQSETATLHSQLLQDSSFSIAPEDAPVDITIINTCTVTAKGDSDVRKLVARARRLNPNVRVALIGCLAQTQKDSLVKLPNVHWIIGNGSKDTVPEILKTTINEDAPRIIVPEIEQKDFRMPATGHFPDHTRANIKVQDGCDCFCSYCEVPYARGRSRSRDLNDVLKEAKELARFGHKEIVLTGVNIGTYKNGHYVLYDLIRALNDIKEIERIRLSSVEPQTMDKRLFKLMFPQGKLCRFLHIPLQNADDTILKAMSRKHTFEDFRAITDSAAEEVPDICLGTDIIVGFPGETDKNFQTTYTRLRLLPLSYFHVFSYSPRPHAASRLLTDDVSAKTKAERSKVLRDLGIQKRNAFYRSLAGKTFQVLFEIKKEGIWSGLTDNYARVKVKTSQNLHNELVKVTVTKADRTSVFGDIVA